MEFLIHVSLGTAIFLLIGLPAVALDTIVKWLSKRDVSDFVIWGLKGAEYLAFGVDLVLYGVFILRTGWRAAKKL